MVILLIRVHLLLSEDLSAGETLLFFPQAFIFLFSLGYYFEAISISTFATILIKIPWRCIRKCFTPEAFTLLRQTILAKATSVYSYHNPLLPLYYFPLYAEYLPSGRSFISPVLYASTRRFTASAPSSVSITSILVLRVSTTFILGLKKS